MWPLFFLFINYSARIERLMTAFLIQNTASAVVVFLPDRYLGVGKENLTSNDVLVSLKKPTDSLFVPKILTPTVAATANIGSGLNGTVTVSVPGTVGNLYTVEVLSPVGTSPLITSIVGNIITISLAVSSGVPISAENTALLIAQSVNAQSDLVDASFSGTGASSLSSAEGPTQLTGGSDGDLVDLGGGYYKLALSSTDTNTVGSLYARIEGPSIGSVVEVANIGAIAPVVPPILPTVPTTVITGSIFTPQGTPYENACVTAKVLSTPAIFDGVAINSNLVVVRTDSNGFFTLELITGSQVDVAINSVGYRRTITVPAISSNLFDIP